MGILDEAWSALGEDAGALALVRDHGDEVPLESALPVGRLVHDAVAAASLSAALLAARRTGSAAPVVDLDPIKLVTSVTSERHFRLDGDVVNAWAELSGFWPTADGWVRTHANYPHHRARLLSALGLADGITQDEFLRHVHGLTAQHIEDVVTSAGGVAVRVRTEGEWAGQPSTAEEAKYIEGLPLLSRYRIGDAPAPQLPATTVDAPARGIRVLDLTRVIAGPVASRTLALWGADVLRIDPPQYPEIEWQHLDGGAGKRSAVVDLDTHRELLDSLAQTADVVITGYRPGGLDRFGLSPAALSERRPGIIVARLSAWGTGGSWAARRGFDSIVQAATGIAWVESNQSVLERTHKPGAMPAQALDHSAGYLLAAGITSVLRRQLDEGGSWLVETSLARVASELLAQPRRSRSAHRASEPPWQPTVQTRTLDDGTTVTSAAAAPHYDGGPADWATGPARLGSSAAEWLPRG